MPHSDKPNSPGRNDPCPCGSGRKYKHCCMRPGDGSGHTPRITKLQAALMILILGTLTVWVWVTSTGSSDDPSPAGPTPAPWTYDAASNRHWDPSPGHQHWHSGPPPPQHRDADQAGNSPGIPGANMPGDTTGTESPATADAPTDGQAPPTAEPWEYDEANDRHWHPGHGHWHRGPPPPQAQR